MYYVVLKQLKKIIMGNWNDDVIMFKEKCWLDYVLVYDHKKTRDSVTYCRLILSCLCGFVVMTEGRTVSPVYRFLTKSGEWVWMQMSAMLAYDPNAKDSCVTNYIFRVIK